MLFINIGHTYDHLFMLLYATVVLALERQFEASYGELLALSFGGFIAFAAGTLPAGWLGDRWSRRGMLAVYFLGLGASAVLTGLATSLVGIAVGLTFIGLFASIYHPIGTAMLVQGRQKIGRLIGINGVFGNMGMAAAALVAGGLSDFWGWRAAFIVPGLVALATGLLFVALAPRMAPPAAAAAAGAGGLGGRRFFLAGLICLAFMTTFAGMIFYATSISMPKLFAERLDLLGDTLSGIGGLVAVIYAIAAMTQIVVGIMVDRYPIKLLLIAVIGLQVPLLLLLASAEGYWLPLVALLLMSLVFGQIPISDTLVARFTTEAWRSRVYAVKYLLSLGVSSISVPLVAVGHGSGGGFATLFMALGGLAVLSALAALTLTARQTQPAAA